MIQLHGSKYKLVFTKDNLSDSDLRISMSVYATVDHNCNYLLARPFSKYKISSIAPAFNLISVNILNAHFAFTDLPANIEQFCNLILVSERMFTTASTDPFQLAEIHSAYFHKHYIPGIKTDNQGNTIIDPNWLKQVISTERSTIA